MRVLIVSQYFVPEPVILPPSIAAGLAERGHEVRVVTGYPNYPDGRIASGYRQQWRGREKHGAFGLIRVPLFIDHSQNAVRRLANYVSFGLSSASAVGAAWRADVVYVYAPQMTAAIGPWIWRLLGGPRYVLHVQDLWPESIIGSSLVSPGLLSRLATRMLDPWLRDVYRRAGAVIAIAPGMRITLTERGADPTTTELVFNWADEPAFAPDRTVHRDDAQTTKVVFAGNVGMMQDLQTAVRAAHAVRDIAGFSLTVVGGGAALAEAQRLRDELGADNVKFAERVSPDQMGPIYRDSDFQLVTLKDLPVFHHTIPSKLQGAFANARPVIISVPGDAARLVEQSEAGFVAMPESVASLEEAFRAAAALDHDGRAAAGAKARAFYDENMSFDESLTRIESILRRVAASSEHQQSRGISG